MSDLYKFEFRQSVTQRGFVVVHAGSAEEADRLARLTVQAGAIAWTTDPWSATAAYVANIEKLGAGDGR